MLATCVRDVAYPSLPYVSTTPLPPPSPGFTLNDLYRCLRTIYSREILHMNIWPAKQAEPPAHTFLTGLPAPRPVMPTMALRHPSQCSC